MAKWEPYGLADVVSRLVMLTSLTRPQRSTNLIRLLTMGEYASKQVSAGKVHWLIYCSALMYNTGDLGQWRPDGQIDILGRVDDQVKIKVSEEPLWN